MRRKDREITDEKTIMEILNKAKVLHLGMIDKYKPYVVPLHYGYEFKSNTLIFYVHGAVEGRKIDIIKENSNVFVEIDTDVELVSGGEIACKYGSYYSSLMGDGKATIVSDVEEKIHGLKLLMQIQTERNFDINEKMAETVSVIKIEIDNFAVKSRYKK